MTKPISISIKETRERIVSAINESHLPPSILEPVLNVIYQQIAQAARTETEQAEKQMEVQDDAESN